MAQKNTHLWIGGTQIFESEEQLLDEVKAATGITPVNVRLIRDTTTGQLAGYGFIKFQNASDATEALRMLKGSIIRIKPQLRWTVNWGTDKNEVTDADSFAKAEGYSCYVGNLPTTVDDEQLLEFFRSHIPTAINSRVIYQNGVHKGFAFVKFSTHQEVIDACNKLNGISAWGRSIKVLEAENNRTLDVNQDTNTILFLSQLDPNIVTEEILIETFSRFGTVIYAKIDPQKPQWALVKMETHSQAESALNDLQGAKFGGITKAIIAWGRDVTATTQSEKSNRIKIPYFKPQNKDKKAHAEFYNKENVHKIINIIQTVAESQREQPLEDRNPKRANRAYAANQVSLMNLYNMECFSDYVNNEQKLWYF